MTAEPSSVALVLGTSAGGVGRHVRSLAGRFVADGLRVVVAGPDPTQETFDFAGTGATFVRVHITRPGTEALAVPALRRATADVDVVHAHGLRAGLAGVFSRRRPLVVTLHNAVLNEGPSRILLTAGERVVARGADVVLGVSPDLVAHARALGAKDARFVPVAAPRLKPVRDAAAVRAELGLTDRQALILCVARLHPQKGLPVLVQASRRWAGLDPAPLVAVVGDGPLAVTLADQIAAERAPVRLLGRREDIADLISVADVVVLPSLWEGWPLVLSEALQLGRPIVATKVGGVPDLVRDAAVLVPAADTDALAAAVASLIQRPGQRRELTQRARRRAMGLPTADVTADAVLAVYRGLVSSQ
ncbi:MAG TPA: glycosyltransferase family 4 protein [Jatrophihabitantaceae bacterium]|nr:glycosyltransferase family 4 protein [Jatrophihabitantaceae bacterium]